MEHFRLLDLPVELRLNIFAHHFGNRTVAATLDAKTMEVTTKRHCCKQLHEEAEGVLWESTGFVVKMKVEAAVVVGGVAYLDTRGDSDPDSTPGHWNAKYRPPYEHPISGLIPLEKTRHAIFNIEIRETEVQRSSSGELWVTKLEVMDQLFNCLAAGKGLKTGELHLELGSFADADDMARDIFTQVLNRMKVNRLRRMSSAAD
ncbi:hypothetical protein LTR37_004155 [Vermiconidia calcicola]|uniref:Uncharacterized protein n=1 Tax=Vermiconidia calcicola TaxID=1690605 RepID=A0ACC3NQE4_9PEZI|nr:hypothetical protein LTR37_004155 [Vermiconidia calcicola]